MMKKLILLFVLLGCILSSAVAFTQSEQMTTPPTYQFQSTSSYSSVVGQSTFSTSTMYAPGSSAPMSQPRKSGAGAWDPWGEGGDGDPTDQGIGQVDTPIGEPLVLLAMALLYVSAMYLRRRSASL